MEMNDDILISYLLGEVSPEQAKQVVEWRNTDEAHDERFSQFKTIWETSRNFKYDGTLNPQASLQRLKEKIAAKNTAEAKTSILNRRDLWLKIAAAILLFAGCGLFYFYLRNVPEVQIATNKEVKADTLSDGSIVTLNKLTILKYPESFSGKQRHVMLTKGEAFFNVAHNKAMPFIINAGNTTIRVVGTSFNVKHKAEGVEVIVETGIVQVMRNGNTVLLQPGEKVLVKSNETFRKQKNPDELYNYYRSKEFVANNTPLWRMIEVLNEAYDSNILIGRKELNNLPLNTTFKNESLDDILVIIGHTFGATIEKKHDQIIIK